MFVKGYNLSVGVLVRKLLVFFSPGASQNIIFSNLGCVLKMSVESAETNSSVILMLLVSPQLVQRIELHLLNFG